MFSQTQNAHRLVPCAYFRAFITQIAAMADSHFEIAKAAKKGRTATTIRRLGDEEAIRELARLLGGAEITEAVLNNAAEMKKLAEQTKQGWQTLTDYNFCFDPY